MNPGKLDLPTIWRGCTYGPVRISWTDDNNHPVNLSGWTPRAYSRYFQFNARVTNAAQGLTTVGLPIQVTQALKLGVTNWDFIWTQDTSFQTVLSPFLKGKVEVKDPVTDPQTNVLGRIGGGSNYVRLFDEFSPDNDKSLQNVIGRYHQSFPFPFEPVPPRPPPSPIPVAPIARDQMAQMYANNQRKLSLLIHFRPAVFYLENLPPFVPPEEWRRQREWMFGFETIAYSPGPFDPSGVYPPNVSLSPQQEINLLAFLEDVKQIGFTQVNFRFGGVGNASNENWGGVWREDRFVHNRNYIFSIIRLIEANKGELKVIYDLGAEFANVRLEKDGRDNANLHRLFCRRLWGAYCNEFDPNDSCAYSCNGSQFRQPTYKCTALGFVFMMDLFKKNHLPFPGYYGFDAYAMAGTPGNRPVYNVLVDTHDFFKDNYPGEDRKPFILQETLYNDVNVALQVERALGDRPGMNLQSIFQWPKLRDHGESDFPDIYPRSYFNYQTL